MTTLCVFQTGLNRSRSDNKRMSWGWGEGYGGAIKLLGTLQPPLFPFARSIESHLLAFMWVFLSVIARFPKPHLALRVI